MTVGPAADDETQDLEITAAVADLGDAVGGATRDPVPQPFGGARWWLRCPGCGTRRAALYLTHGTDARLRCRMCLRLAYHAERYDPMRRTEHRMRRVVRLLCSGGPDLSPVLRATHYGS